MEKKVESMTPGSRNLGEKHKNGKFGYFGCNPPCLQWLNNPWVFLALIVLAVVANTCAVVGVLITFLPHIEKRFNLSGFDSGMIAASNDVPAVLFGLFVAHWGHFGNKVRWIGIGGIITGIGLFIVTIPHYIIDDYKPPTPENILCNAASANGTAECKDNTEIAERYHLALILIGQFVAGVGTIPLFAFPPAIFRETVIQKYVPGCYAFWQVSVFIGPLVAFAFSEALLETWVDLGEPPSNLFLTPEDPRWISAWWLAFLGPAVACFLVGVITLGMPEHIRTQLTDDQLEEIAKIDDNIRHMTLREKMAEIPKILQELLTNVTYMFNVLAFNTSLLFAEGIAPFIAKILILRFGVNVQDVGKVLNVAVVPPLVLGVAFSIILSRVVKTEVSGKKASLICFLLQFGAFFPTISTSLPGCKLVRMPGYSVDYGVRIPNGNGFNLTKTYPGVSKFPLGSTCNENCSCGLNLGVPMCGSDGVTYLNPCFAGCTVPSPNLVFENCSCIWSEDGYGGKGTVGFCDADCKNWLEFLALISLFSFITFAQLSPSKVVVMKSVKAEHLSFAFALHYLSNKLIANIPGPILFGHVVDLSCDIWQKVCDKTGFCIIYDLDHMMDQLTIITGTLGGFGLVFYFIMWIVYKDAEPSEQKKSGYEVENPGFQGDSGKDSIDTRM